MSSDAVPGDEPELPPDLNRADATAQLELPPVSKEEALDLLAKSMAAFESLQGSPQAAVSPLSSGGSVG